MNWYLKCFRQYADFKGRARRKEYWMFTLFSFVVALVFAAVIYYLVSQNLMSMAFGAYGISSVYLLASMIPTLAVCMRRLHDIGKSGTTIFISLIPLVGAIWLLILLCKDSQPKKNKWGKVQKKIYFEDDEFALQNTNSAGLSMTDICLKNIKKYVDFKGRADKKEFWTFAFVCTFLTNAVALIMCVISFILNHPTFAIIGYCVCAVFLVATLLPFLASMVRRLHDMGQSGWMVLTALIPFAGPIWLIKMLSEDSQSGCNKWGSKPKKLPKQIISEDNEADAATDGNSSVAEIPTEAVQI